MCEQTPRMTPLKSVRKKRRRRNDTATPLIFLSLLQRWNLAAADGSSYSNSNGNNNNGQQQSQQQQDGQEQSYSSSKGILTVEKSCRKKSVVVTSARLTCDSPGAYYYGSKTYRGSAVCIDGDKAHLKVRLTIAEDVDPSSSIYVQIEAGLYQNYKNVLAPSKLCQMQIQAAEGYGQKCPYPGDYVFESYFYLPKMLEDNTEFHFTPDINMTFTDENLNRVGCAVTGTAALQREASRRHKTGMVALGIGLAVFGFVFGGLLILAYRRRKRLESLTERKTQRYQYFRTLPNGQVVPLQPGQVPGPPSHPRAPPPQQVPYHMPPGMPPGPPQEAYQISNPAYNETQLPTRPVI